MPRYDRFIGKTQPTIWTTTAPPPAPIDLPDDFGLDDTAADSVIRIIGIAVFATLAIAAAVLWLVMA